MSSDEEKGSKLLALALHDQTPEHERNAAAIALCRLVRRMGLFDPQKAGPPPPAPRATSYSEPIARARSYEDYRAMPDQVLRPTMLVGWTWVLLGKSQFCRSGGGGAGGTGGCLRTGRGNNVIYLGTVAAVRNGEYQHEECHKRWGG